VFLKIAAFVVPLGFDTFAVAVLLGLRRMRRLARRRPSPSSKR
jgi:hypothetical protein